MAVMDASVSSIVGGANRVDLRGFQLGRLDSVGRGGMWSMGVWWAVYPQFPIDSLNVEMTVGASFAR